MSRVRIPEQALSAQAEPFVTMHVAMRFSRRAGRKLVLVPEHGAQTAHAAEVRPGLKDDPVLRAVVRAFRWKAQLDAGELTSVADIARVEKLDRRYVGRIRQLTLLSRQTVELIVQPCMSPTVSLEQLYDFPNVSWAEQDAITSGDRSRGTVKLQARSER